MKSLWLTSSLHNRGGSDVSIEVDLSRFLDTGDPAPDQTVLTDQWASIKILFDAEPDGVDLVKEDFGGSESKGIRMAIQGTFRVVEWRTHGNPGIAARGIVLEF